MVKLNKKEKLIERSRTFAIRGYYDLDGKPKIKKKYLKEFKLEVKNKKYWYQPFI